MSQFYEWYDKLKYLVVILLNFIHWRRKHSWVSWWINLGLLRHDADGNINIPDSDTIKLYKSPVLLQVWGQVNRILSAYVPG